MIVNKENTETILKNMRSEGHNSRADYIELMQQRIAELEQREAELSAHVERIYKTAKSKKHGVSDLRAVIGLTPNTSLNAVRRDSFAFGYEQGAIDHASGFYDYDYLAKGERVANQRYPDKE